MNGQVQGGATIGRASPTGRAALKLGWRRWLLAALVLATAVSLSNGVASAAEVEKAVGRTATSSSVKSGGGYEPAKALDQNATTRWSSVFGVDNQWWQVDLGSVTDVSRVTVDWFTSYATEYIVSVSANGSSFEPVVTVKNSAAGLKSTSFAARNARYVRITGVTRAVAQYGISFWEARVYGAGSTPPPGSTPWTSPVPLPGTIQAEEYNKGGEGIAYHDLDTANLGGAFRPTEGVDVEATTDTGGGYAIGHIRAGEWTDYTVTVATAGPYDLGLRWASNNNGGKAHLDRNGTNVSGTINLGSTGGWQTWSTIWVSGVSLPAGTSVLRFMMDSNNGEAEVGNLNAITVRNAVVPVKPSWPSTWTAKATAPETRFESAAAVVGGKVYSFGSFRDSAFHVGRDYMTYNPATDAWTVLGQLPVGMAETHLGIAEDGRYIYFMGGFGGDIQSTSPSQWISDQVWSYDTQLDVWTPIAQMPAARGAGGLALVGRRLHYFGGNPADRVSNKGDHFVYDLDTGSWSPAAAMPDPKDHFSVVVINTKIYAIGGERGHDQLHQQASSVHVYDTTTNAWTQLASMPVAKSHTEGGTFVSDGKIIMAGGQIDGFQPTAGVISYDPGVDGWATLSPSLPAMRQGAIVQRVGQQIVLALGAAQTNQPQAGTWIGQLP